MLPTEQPRFFELVADALAEYTKRPDQAELEAWWTTCKGLALADVERALKAHADHHDDGKRAPRPVDIRRRVAAGSAEGSRCAARDATGQCEYPGIFSDGTGGEGPWYCPWHRMERAGPEASRWIETSRNVPWEVASERRAKRMNIEATKAPGVVETAQAIARRHGDKPWQAGLAKLLPQRQESDESEAA